MYKNAFADKPRKPSDSELTLALGPAKPLWDYLIAAAKELGAADEEWKSYSPKYGWTLRLKKKKRTIVYLSPGTGSFLVSLVLGDRAMAQARQRGLPKTMLKLLADATRYPEGTAIRTNVRKKADVGRVMKLIAIKLGN